MYRYGYNVNINCYIFRKIEVDAANKRILSIVLKNKEKVRDSFGKISKQKRTRVGH